MRTLLAIASLAALIGACADVSNDAPAVETGALTELSIAPTMELEAAPTLTMHPAIAYATATATFGRPNDGLRESHVAPSFRPGCFADVRFAGTVGAHDEIDLFRLPACLDEAPALGTLLPQVFAQYGEEATQGERVDAQTLVDEGLATEAQLDAMDTAAGAHDEDVEYYVANAGDHTLIVAYYPDQGRLFGIIVTVGDELP